MALLFVCSPAHLWYIPELFLLSHCTEHTTLHRYLDGPIADLNNSSSTYCNVNPDHTVDYTSDNEHDNNNDDDNTHSDTERHFDLDINSEHVNTQFTHTQSNIQETVSGISYTNKNRVNKSGRSKLQEKFYRMSAALCEVVDDYGLVSFHPMNIEDVEVKCNVVCCCVLLCIVGVVRIILWREVWMINMC